jgi:hypothetical protein
MAPINKQQGDKVMRSNLIDLAFEIVTPMHATYGQIKEL